MNHLRNIRDRCVETWDAPWFDKWVQLALIAMLVTPLFVFFALTDLDDQTDNTITLGISLALFLGIVASIKTTDKYAPRGLGLLTATIGSCIYFFFLYLLRSDKGLFYWMSDLTRAFFTVGAPIFATATIVALVNRNRSQRKEEMQWPSKQPTTLSDHREERPKDGSTP